MIWWRIELDKTGAILKCDQVEATGRDNRLVRYVEATTKAEACSTVKAWHSKLTAFERERSAVRRNLAKQEGKCTVCRSRLALPRRATCQKCGDQARINQQKLRDGKSPTPKKTPEQRYAQSHGGKETPSKGVRPLGPHMPIRRLDSILDKLDTLIRQYPNSANTCLQEFRTWLEAEIEKGAHAGLDSRSVETPQPFAGQS